MTSTRAARRRTESGMTLLEIIIAIMLASFLVMALVAGLLTTAEATNGTNDAQRVDNAIKGFGESLKQLTYKDCGDATWYQSIYDTDVALRDPGTSYATVDMRIARVVDVDFWAPGSFPASGPNTPGQFQDTCSTGASGTGDAGAQRITYEVGFGSVTQEAQVVKRNPLASEFYTGVVTTLPPGPGGPNTAPIAAFTLTPSGGAAPLDVTFDASGSVDPDGDPMTYLWTFGDGGSATGATPPPHRFVPGLFSVKLAVTDDEGAVGYLSKSISVTGTPAAPTGLAMTKAVVQAGNSYATFSWNAVPGANEYQIDVRKTSGLFGCNGASGSFIAPVANGTVTLGGVCTPSFVWHFAVKIRTRAGATWGPWSPEINVP